MSQHNPATPTSFRTNCRTTTSEVPASFAPPSAAAQATDLRLTNTKVLAFAFGRTGYRGVHWDASCKCFKAEIGNRYRGTRKRLGRFATADAAAEAYDIAAMEMYGDKAVLNFPLAGYRMVLAVRDNPSHCASGHLMDEANTYVSPDGRRNCRECNRLAAARSYHRRAGK